MPPKKGAKKAAKGKGAKVESAAPPEISKEELEEQIVRLREELDREREERNYFQLERDEIHTFLEIAKRQLEESKAGLRNKDLEKEETEELHREQIKVYKQKVKHLLYEHQNAISELKAERVVSTKMMETEHAGQENELRKDMRDLKVDFKEQKIAYQNHVKDLQLKHDEELTQTRNNFEGQVREIEAKYETKMHTLRQEQDCRRKTEIREIEDRKNSQITTLMKNHEKAFNDTKNYYNDITRSKMELIDTLKEQVENMKKKDEKKDKDMAEISQQNKHMTETMQKATEEVTDLQKQVLNYHKDKASLANARARLKANEQDLKDLKWEHELLEQKFSKIQTERDELYQKFTQAIQEVQQKSGFKNLLLERKLEALTDTLETKEAQLNEVLSATNMDQRAFGGMTHKFEEVLDSKNAAIKNLQYELARVCKAHNDLLRTYEAKLGEFGIPVEELGFKPLENSITGQTLGQGPAHSVSAAK